MENRLSLKSLITVVTQNIRGIMLTYIILMSISVVSIIFAERVYEARTLIQIEVKDQSQIAGFAGLGADLAEVDLNNQERIYKSRSVLSQVVKKLELEFPVEFLQQRIQRVGGQTGTYFIQRGGLLEFRIQDTDKNRAVQILQEANNAYLNQNVKRQSEEARNSINFLDENIARIEQSLTNSIDKLNNFKEDALLYDISIEAKATLENLNLIEQELSNLEIKETEISQSYKIDHPVYKTLINQKEVLLNRKAKLNEDISNLPQDEKDLLELTREVNLNENTLEILQNRKLELSVVEASKTGNVRIIDEPYVQLYPVSPQPIRSLAVFFFLSSLVSLFYIFLREYFFKKINTTDEISANTEIPILGVIPQDSSELNSMTSLKDISNSEPFKSLAVSMLSRFKDDKKFMICGPTSGIGKSFVAINTAFTLASFKKKVLLIDLDLRRGDLHEVLNVDNSLGFNYEKQPEIVKCSEFVDFVARGKKINDYFSILNSPNLNNLIKNNEDKYDYIIFDTPPILSVSDIYVISKFVDRSFLILRQGKSKMRELEFSLQNMKDFGLEPSGIIVNGYKASGSYYGYDYYAYKYRGNYDYDG